jgi:hypothetical protein
VNDRERRREGKNKRRTRRGEGEGTRIREENLDDFLVITTTAFKTNYY